MTETSEDQASTPVLQDIVSTCDHVNEREEEEFETPIEVPEISEINYTSIKPNRVFDSKPIQGMMKQLKGDSEV